MLGDMNGSQERTILALMSKITSIIDLSTLLEVVVQELPSVVGARGCWIYLQPEYTPKYNGVLQRGDNEISESELSGQFDDFIVLAATNLESKKALIGKAYFGAGEGITGWVYKNSKSLRISDVTDEIELKSLSSELAWFNEYHDGDELYEKDQKRPLLAVPLILDGDSIGTLKFHATLNKEPFSNISQEIAIIVSQLISGVIRQSWMVEEQSQIISRLIETSNKQDYLDVIADVTDSMRDMLNCLSTEFFLRSEDGSKLSLVAKNGMSIEQPSTPSISRGESLVGWVFKTGCPLIIADVKRFVNGIRLDDDLLTIVSNGQEINEEDRFLRYYQDLPNSPTTNKLQAISFLAVPVKSKDHEVQGVLCAYRSISAKTRTPFERTQLILATSFANTIALVLENTRQRALADLLIKLGDLTQTDQLFHTVAENIPRLVVSSGCSIYTSSSSNGILHLNLIHTSRKDIIRDGNSLPKIEYGLGEGKTGVCGLYQSPVVTNHYGVGQVSFERMNREIERIRSEHPDDITSVLTDTLNNKVGLFQLQSDEKLPINKRYAIRDFANTIIFEQNGIVSHKLNSYLAENSDSTWSFLAVPGSG